MRRNYMWFMMESLQQIIPAIMMTLLLEVIDNGKSISG
jgi:hypothetical protein